MMRKIITVLCLSILFFACKKSKEDDVVVCGVKNPIQNLGWLNQKYKLFTGGTEMNSIVLYEYNGSQIIQVNQSVSSKMYDVYNCNGESLMFNDANGLNSFLASRKTIKVLYGTWQLN